MRGVCARWKGLRQVRGVIQGSRGGCGDMCVCVGGVFVLQGVGEGRGCRASVVV